MTVDSEPRSVSIGLRLRRTTYEDASIGVPVTEAILRPDDQGILRIDPDAFRDEVTRLGLDPRIGWQRASEAIEMHPTQQPLPDGGSTLDFWDDAAGS